MSDIHAAREQHELERQLHDTSTWRPMETAPKNGRHVLLLVEGKAIEGWWSDEWPRWAVVWLDTHGCGCCGGDPAEPKGWLPLPGSA